MWIFLLGGIKFSLYGIEEESGLVIGMNETVSTISQTLHAWVVTLLNHINSISASQVSGSSSSVINSAYKWLVSMNPVVLIIIGVVAFFAGALSKFIGIIMVIAGIILLVLPYLGIIH